MESIQVNGQRIWGPPKGWSGPVPPHGTEVFIKNIPEDVMETDLWTAFSTVGEIYEIRVPVHWSGYNRGYAFVRYTKTHYATRAIRELDNFEIRFGWHLKVERSIDNNRLFLSAVPNDKTGNEILETLKAAVENVKKVYVYPSMDDPVKFRGYAFVEFDTHRDAAIAKRILTPDLCFNLFERKCVAAWANPLPFLQDNILETINILFMRNLPSNLKTLTIKKMIEVFVGGNSVNRIKRLNDIAFITFRNHVAAKKTLDLMKSHPLVLGQNEIEVEWAVPRQLALSRMPCLNSVSEIQVPSDYKEKIQRVREIVEVTWNSRLKKMKHMNNILMKDSNLTDWQKNFVDATSKGKDTIIQIAEELKKRHLCPEDFINNNIITVAEPLEDLVIDEFRDYEADSKDSCRLTHLHFWFKKMADEMKGCKISPLGLKDLNEKWKDLDGDSNNEGEFFNGFNSPEDHKEKKI